MDRLIVACPNCQARFDVSAFRPGSKIRCGSCYKILRIPESAGARKEPAKTPTEADTGGPDTGTPSTPTSPPVAEKKVKAAPAPKKAKAPVAAATKTPPAEKTEKEKKPEPAKPSTLVGTLINQEFQLIRKIGEGGYGSVYEATDLTLQRRVAVKLMLREKTKRKEFVEKFLREARTAAQLSHPNIVKIHMVGFDKGLEQHFLAMEFVEGRSLSQIMKSEGAFPIDKGVDIITQAAKGLGEAHKKNIIHRDIKPGNIMITPKGVVKVADFGLAKVYDPGDAASTVIGTPFFMPPEQFDGKVRDGRTDIYALGITFYYMLTKKRPFDGRTPAEVLLNIMKQDPVPPQQYNADVPEGLWTIIQKMIARNVDERYATCEELLRDLKIYLDAADAEEKVHCPSCGFANAYGTEKCVECGKSLLEPCPSCGTPDFIGAKFCGSCGANLAAEKQIQLLISEAESHVAAGRLESAIDTYRKARDASPENSRAIEGLRLAEQNLGERDEMAESIEAHLDAERFAEAFELAQQAVERFAGHDRLAELLTRAESGAKGIRLSAALKETRTLLSSGDLYDACAAARRALEIDPGSDDALALLNDAEAKLEKLADAKDRAVRSEEEGRLEDSLNAWREASELSPSDQAVTQAITRISGVLEQVGRLRARGEAALEERDLSRARTALEDAIRVFASDPGTLEALDRLRAEEQRLATGLTEALEQVIAGRIQAGIEKLTVLAKDFPDEPMIRMGIEHANALNTAAESFLSQGRALLDFRRPALASVFVRAAEKIAPLDRRAGEVLKEIDRESKLQEEALGRARELLDAKEYANVLEHLDPLGGVASPSLLAAELAKEADRGVREKQAKARDKKREVLESTIQTARELFDAGRVDAALAACQKALRIDRNFEEARALKQEIDSVIGLREKGEENSSIDTAFFQLDEMESSS